MIVLRFLPSSFSIETRNCSGNRVRSVPNELQAVSCPGLMIDFCFHTTMG